MSQRRTGATNTEKLRPGPSGQAPGPAEIMPLLATGNASIGSPAPVVMRETHASQVFLTRFDVFKLKKAVDLGFLNYSTLRRRARMCRQEVLLNRRLAPEVYLGVERLTREPDGSLALNGRGSVVDYLVHMKRLPDDRSLAGLLEADTARHADVERVGVRIGAFHRVAAPASPAFGPRMFLSNAKENLRQLRSTMSGSYLNGAGQELV